METCSTIQGTRDAVARLKSQGRSVGLVPTMGALHHAHRSLVDAARARCDAVVVSIFVNPTQFAPTDDFERYPRPLQADLDICRNSGVDLVFTPTVDAMYPSSVATTVHVAGLTDHLCGPFRPGHFDGVATVVAKLLNIITPDVAFFGEKDYQQLRVIETMVNDLDLPVDIVPCPTIREPDGLAVSSRNAYLSRSERQQATSLSRAIGSAAQQCAQGQRDASALIAHARRIIQDAGPAEIDYIEIVDSHSLKPIARIDAPARICLAVRIGSCRLIDNMPLDAP